MSFLSFSSTPGGRSTPHEFLTNVPNYPGNPLPGKAVSDCEEKANTLVSIMRAQGIPPEEVRVVLGEVAFGDSETGHAWVELSLGGQWMVLDPCMGPYWDDRVEKISCRQGVPFEYYRSHVYPVIQVWTYYNDIYYLDVRSVSGDAPASWGRSFEDLKGFRAEGYIRDSTLDQRDGFGPEIQHKNIIRFAENYGLVLGTKWYTEYVSSFRRWDKRKTMHQFLDDAKLDKYDVLLVDRTSRFGRNQKECIRYKEELTQLGKTVIFVSQGIISGCDRDFLNERINETLDEQYSRNLSYYVAEGLGRKTAHGLHVGPAPLGYKSELQSGQPERKVPDLVTMPALLTALRDYDSGRFSLHEVAEHLNSLGYRTRYGKPFTGHTIMDILHNRFYEGKVIYHKGLPDEKIVDGKHEVSPEVRELWLRCQQVKDERRVSTRGQPRGPARHFIYSKVLRCGRCHQPWYGETVYQSGNANLRLSHERHNAGRDCEVRPRSQSLEAFSHQFQDRVLPYLVLPDMWKDMILAATQREDERQVDGNEIPRLQQALENIRKQHKWGDLSDDAYRQERLDLERQMKLLSPTPQPRNLPNLESAAELLKNMTALWSHSGVIDEQRESFITEVFGEITIDGKHLTAIEPKPTYMPLFATMPLNSEYGYCKTDSAPSPPESRENECFLHP